MTSASDSAHSMSWVYDPLGRVTSKSQTVGGVIRTVGYGYTNGLLTSMTTPSGQAVAYSYTNGQVTGITVNGTSLLSGVVYEPFGPARSWTWGNATLETRLHDTDGNPSLFTGAESTSYNIDNAFRIQGIANSNTPAASWGYGYDALDRVTSGTSGSTAISWTYDANGNRQTQGGAAGPAYAASSLTFTYNNRGRMASAASVGTTNYIYSALGQRIQKSGTGGTVLFSYDEAGHLLGEYSNAGALIQETIWLGDLPVATIRPGTPVVVYYVHADHLGTPRAVTRSSDNAKVWRWDSDPFGVAPANQNPSGLGAFTYNLRYPGQYFDGETGLSYNYFRDYDSQNGRYVESDPIGLNGGINPYRYSYNSPIQYFDDFGLDPCAQLVCFPSFAKDNVVSSTLIDPGQWSLINVSVDPERLLNQSPLSNPQGKGGVIGLFSPARVAICFFAKTRSYREEHSRSREWHCLEVCATCGGQQFRWSSYVESLGSYEKIRREREQQVQQIKAILPEIRCKEILSGLH